MTSTTRFRNLSPLLARILLVVLVAIIGYGSSIDFRGVLDPQPELAPDKGDVELYATIVGRVRAGENYYRVTGAELIARGYPVKPFLTWRLPTATWLIAALPDNKAASILLNLLVVALALAWVWQLQSLVVAWPKVIVGVLLLTSGCIGCLAPNGIFFQELWAMICIAGALALYRERTWGWSVALGTLALLFRELALPFACAMLVCAFFERRRAETVAWTVGIAVFAVALGLHAAAVNAVAVPALARQSQGWLVLGGWGFVLSASQWNVLAALLPKAAIPVLIPLALLGLAAWNSQLGARIALTMAFYVAAFLVVGRPDNDYWGLIYAPLLSLGLLFAPAALRDLARAALTTAPAHVPQR